jgi:hypothetical protein
MIFYLQQPQQGLMLLKTKTKQKRISSGKYDWMACAQKADNPNFRINIIHRNKSACKHRVPLVDIGVELLELFGGST